MRRAPRTSRATLYLAQLRPRTWAMALEEPDDDRAQRHARTAMAIARRARIIRADSGCRRRGTVRRGNAGGDRDDQPHWAASVAGRCRARDERPHRHLRGARTGAGWLARRRWRAWPGAGRR